jgi:hypothetical protein
LIFFAFLTFFGCGPVFCRPSWPANERASPH